MTQVQYRPLNDDHRVVGTSIRTYISGKVHRISVTRSAPSCFQKGALHCQLYSLTLTPLREDRNRRAGDLNEEDGTGLNHVRATYLNEAQDLGVVHVDTAFDHCTEVA